MFMENKVLNYTFQLELYVTTQENKDVKVHITSPKWTSPFVNERFTVKAGSVHKVLIDPSFRMYGNGISNKSLHVTADAEVVCYGSNKESLSNDVYLGIPTDALGTEYYAMTYSPAEIKSEIGIAATADKTDVKITLPKTNGDLNVTFQGRIYKQGDQIQVTLDKFETLQIQSSGDLTGKWCNCTFFLRETIFKLLQVTVVGKFIEHSSKTLVHRKVHNYESKDRTIGMAHI